MASYHIKFRERGAPTFCFLAPGGRSTRLRIHASIIPADAVEGRLAELRQAYPALEFVANPASRQQPRPTPAAPGNRGPDGVEPSISLERPRD